MCRSEWHTPERVMRTSTSVPVGFGVSCMHFLQGLAVLDDLIADHASSAVLASSAWSMSHRMSSIDSMPTDMRTMSGSDARLQLLLVAHLPVRGRGRVDDQRLRVADVGEVAHELRGLDEVLARPGAALDAEIEQAGGALAAGTSARARSTCCPAAPDSSPRPPAGGPAGTSPPRARSRSAGPCAPAAIRGPAAAARR